MENIIIPNNVITINENAFYKCVKLSNIIIPENVIIIENNTFYNCSSLKNMIIPNSTRSIGDRAFYRCSNLILLIIGKGCVNIGSDFISPSNKISILLNNIFTTFNKFSYNVEKKFNINIYYYPNSYYINLPDTLKPYFLPILINNKILLNTLNGKNTDAIYNNLKNIKEYSTEYITLKYQ